MPGNSCSVLILTMLCIAPPLLASQDEGSETLPSTELLEYLGQLVELDDELIGPELFNIDEENEQSEETDEDAATRKEKTPDKKEDSHD